MVEVRLETSGTNAAQVGEIAAAAGGELVSTTGSKGGDQEIVLHVQKANFHDLAARLHEAGCRTVTARELEFIYGANNPLFAALELERAQAAERKS